MPTTIFDVFYEPHAQNSLKASLELNPKTRKGSRAEFRQNANEAQKRSVFAVEVMGLTHWFCVAIDPSRTLEGPPLGLADFWGMFGARCSFSLLDRRTQIFRRPVRKNPPCKFGWRIHSYHFVTTYELDGVHMIWPDWCRIGRLSIRITLWLFSCRFFPATGSLAHHINFYSWNPSIHCLLCCNIQEGIKMCTCSCTQGALKVNLYSQKCVRISPA